MILHSLDLKPKDVLAMLLVVSFVLFKLTGHNGSLDVSVAVIIGYYFARRQEGRDTGK